MVSEISQRKKKSNQQGSSKIEIHVVYTVRKSRKSLHSPEGQNKRLRCS